MDVSVICPFYNEAEIIEEAVETLVQRLRALDGAWELILVNDGSTDGSEELAWRAARGDPNVRVLGYSGNRGRGYALRVGIAAAQGEVLVTTEIDLSWGEDIVHRLVGAMREWPDADVIVASPNLPQGGYRNVPWKRVWLSRIGNRVIRALGCDAVTMNTGMTRAYRREVVQSLPLSEDGKEFHLEVILKAVAFGLRIREIPAVLEWREYKHRGQRVKRKSSSRANRLIVSHSLFSVLANPVRYVWAMSLAACVLGGLGFGWALLLLYTGEVSAFVALMSVSLVVVGMVLFVLGVVVKQGSMIQKELWCIQRHQLQAQGDVSPAGDDRPELREGPRRALIAGKRE